jgi:hypothetical protein
MRWGSARGSTSTSEDGSFGEVPPAALRYGGPDPMMAPTVTRIDAERPCER